MISSTSSILTILIEQAGVHCCSALSHFDPGSLSLTTIFIDTHFSLIIYDIFAENPLQQVSMFRALMVTHHNDGIIEELSSDV